MFAIQRGYLDGRAASAASGCPTATSTSSAHVDGSGAAFAVRAEPTVPCNNDLLAGNFIDDGEKIWLIDYEYSGNNEACFELGNIWSEAGLPLDQLDELMAAYDGDAAPAPGRPGPAVGTDVEVRLDAVGLDPGRRERASTSTSGSWAMEKYDRAVAEFDGPDFERLLDEVTGDD